MSMTILESKLYGIPLVTYELPYLELLQDKKGVITVKQGDISGAAYAILKLVNDPALHHRLSVEARNPIVNFYETHKSWKKWIEVIQSTLNNCLINKTKDAKYNLMFWDILQGFYKKSKQQTFCPTNYLSQQRINE